MVIFSQIFAVLLYYVFVLLSKGIQMTKKMHLLQDLLSPVHGDDELHLEEDLAPYFMEKTNSHLGASNDGEEGAEDEIKSHELDEKGGWASVYGLDMGRTNESFVHLVCALFCPRTWLKNNNRWCNLKSEVRRSGHFKCSVCGLKGPTVGCFYSCCRQIVHVPCALKQGWKPSLSQKPYYCLEHMKTVTAAENGNLSVNNIDISRGYEPLPVTMDACPCMSCVRNTSSITAPICHELTTLNNANREMIELGIYERSDEVSTPATTLVKSCDTTFLYITRNIDHEDVNSWSCKVNSISKFCDLCSGVDCGDNVDGSRCDCAFQVPSIIDS